MCTSIQQDNSIVSLHNVRHFYCEPIEFLFLKNFMANISLTLREKFFKVCSAKSKLLDNNNV